MMRFLNQRFSILILGAMGTFVLGPDSTRTISEAVVTETSLHIQVECTSSVLHLRGNEVVAQPHINDNGDILCWNGEIFEGCSIALDENDGAKLFSLLTTSQDADVPSIMHTLEGPYAFVFYQADAPAILLS